LYYEVYALGVRKEASGRMRGTGDRRREALTKINPIVKRVTMLGF